MLKIILVIVICLLVCLPHLIGEEKVIIAVASDGETLNSSVSHVAARSPYFLIFDSKGKPLEAVENPYKNTRGGAGVLTVKFLAERNVTIVVAGNFGDKMKEALEANEIAYLEFEGIVENAIQKILEEEERT